MLTGIKLRANPTSHQKLILSQWMGCARSIWNAKVEEERYYRTYARKYCTIGTYAPIDQTTSQFKSKELSPWLSECPSQILRNSAVNWYQTYQKFMSGKCGRPKRKPKTDKGSIYLTREVFRFDHCDDGNVRLFIGTKTNNIGYLSFKAHGKFEIPNSLYVRKERGHYYVSFCYEQGQPDRKLSTNEEHLAFLQGATREYLEEHTMGVDRGVAIPVCAGEQTYDFTHSQKKNMSKADRYNKAFNSGIVVAYEQKEAGIDMASRLWRSDADLNRLMWPVMMCWLLQGYLDEGEYKAVTQEDLSEIAIDCMDYCCYYYVGSTPLQAVGDVLKELKTDCFFPPVAIWMQGKLNEEVSLIPYFSENYIRV